MSFDVKRGNLFDNVECGHIIHGCNAQGVMGSGVAAIIRAKYPMAYKTYIYQADTGYILGEVIPAIVEPNLMIINAIMIFVISCSFQIPGVNVCTDTFLSET